MNLCICIFRQTRFNLHLIKKISIFFRKRQTILLTYLIKIMQNCSALTRHWRYNKFSLVIMYSLYNTYLEMNNIWWRCFIEKSIYLTHYSAETKIVYINMATSWWDIYKISALYLSADFFLEVPITFYLLMYLAYL